MCIFFLILCAVQLASSNALYTKSFYDESGILIDQYVSDSIIKTSNGDVYRLTYNMELLGGDQIIDLDDEPAVKDLHCDISHIELTIEFTSQAKADYYLKIFNNQSNLRYVTGEKWNCTDIKSSSFMLFRKVFSAEKKAAILTLRTTQGHYEEVMKTGEIKVEPLPKEYSKTVCIGVNANQDCEAAAGNIPIYEGKFLKITCTNCFVGAKATVFMDMAISNFKLKRIAAGLRDMAVNGAFVMDATAQADWAVGVDKEYKVVDRAIILQFWIGPIPMTISYELPVHIVANAMIDAAGYAQVGAKASWKLGDAYLSWDDKNSWRVVKPNPVFNFEKVLKGEARFDGDGMVSIIPSIIVHIMRVIKTSIKLEPAVMLDAKGNLEKKEICADLSYKAKSEIYAELKVNIPLINIKIEKEFGPHTLFDTGVKQIGHFCEKAQQQGRFI